MATLAPRNRKTTVLLVEADLKILTRLQRILARSPYTVLSERTAPAAIEVLEADGRKVDVVVADERLPGATGSAFLTDVRLLQPAAVRIVLTEEDPSFIMAIGSIDDRAAAFLRKDCDPDELLRVIASELDRRRV